MGKQMIKGKVRYLAVFENLQFLVKSLTYTVLSAFLSMMGKLRPSLEKMYSFSSRRILDSMGSHLAQILGLSVPGINHQSLKLFD
ncbi:unnamed protein product [Larinioides sclopetarius]|uniref:Uncharacterized protein n=1 Tax=Larinioides sclopetarius TaxID=280406 RepID=A0AAV2BWC4_9ARAC